VNRALRAATIGVLLLSPVVFSACSAGQVTQTATQERDKVGAMAQVGELTIRAVKFVSPRGGAYDRGDDAELQMAIVNSGDKPDALVGISGDGFDGVEFSAGSSSSASTSASAGTTASPSATAGSSTTASAGSSATASASASATNSGSASATSAGPSSSAAAANRIEIPANSTVFIGMNGASVTLTNLTQPLTTGQYLELTFEFENAGRVTLPVTVATPTKPMDRGETFDFHPTEGG
jgi:hypothetical protein